MLFRLSSSATKGINPSVWAPILIGTLLFWLSSSLMLDLVVMPTLYVSGMMTEPGFAATGFTLFSVFNRVELVCAGIICTGVLVATLASYPNQVKALFQYWNFNLTLAVGLLAIALMYTYGLTPEMGGLGIGLDALNPQTTVPAGMDMLHGSYWLIEMVKLAIGALLLRAIVRRVNAPTVGAE